MKQWLSAGGEHSVYASAGGLVWPCRDSLVVFGRAAGHGLHTWLNLSKCTFVPCVRQAEAGSLSLKEALDKDEGHGREGRPILTGKGMAGLKSWKPKEWVNSVWSPLISVLEEGAQNQPAWARGYADALYRLWREVL